MTNRIIVLISPQVIYMLYDTYTIGNTLLTHLYLTAMTSTYRRELAEYVKLSNNIIVVFESANKSAQSDV